MAHAELDTTSRQIIGTMAD